jgi:hypothetical protein
MASWLQIPKYEGAYEASERGQIRSVARVVNWGKHGSTRYRARELKQFKSENGYWCVKLSLRGSSRTEYVHELILRSFIGPRPVIKETSAIRHLDGDKSNNYLSNLLYGTARENALDYQKHKRVSK